MTRLLALVAAVVCGGAALHLSGATAAGEPERTVEIGTATDDATGESAGFADILGRVDMPAVVVPAGDGAGTAVDGEGRPGDLLVADAPFVPVGLQVGAAGVRAPVDPMGLEPNGELEVPEGGSRTGWWRGGPRAGEAGPTVLVGHVDFRGGQAGVFHALELLETGDRARVTSGDGRYVEYEITRVETFAKGEFPTEEVYGPTPGAELRLITCGGPFNPLRRSYRDNVIAYASLVPPSG